ncbi:MAG: T9SS type A sorting domain-containing protein [Saprospiraceae bacterium]
MKKIYILSLLLSTAIFGQLKAQCLIGDLLVDYGICNNLNEFSVTLDFEWGGGADSFVVAGNGNNYGTYAKADLPVILYSPSFIGDGITVYEFVVYDTELMADCSADTGLGPVTCGPASDCAITNLSYTSICDLNDQVFITLNFDWEYSGNSFSVVGNGNNYGDFSYADVPVTLGPFDGDGSAYEFVVTDNVYSDCSEWVETEQIFCGANDCEITDFIIEPWACEDDGTFLVDIDFNAQNASDSFDLVISNASTTILQSYAYTDLYITIGPLTGDGSTYIFTVIDSQYPNCGISESLISEDCGGGNDCQILDMEVEAFNCNPNGNYDLFVNFEVETPGNDFYDLYVNEEYYDSFLISDLPLEFTYTGSPNSSGSVKVCVNDVPECCKSVDYENPCIISTNCEIGDIMVEASDCDDNDNFNAVITFDHANTSDFFNLSGNGNDYGTFAYSDLPIILSDLEGNGMVYEFVVTDEENPDCYNLIEWDSEDCTPNTDCEISNAILLASDCDDEGEFNTIINFSHANTSDQFTIVGNGNNYGTFSYNDLPITISDLVADGTTYEFIIKDVENPDCSVSLGYDSENCIGGGDCEILELDVEAIDCDPDGIYFITVNFVVENPGNDFFDVFVNDEFNNFYAIADLPITFLYEGSPNSGGSVKVCMNDNPDCCATGEYVTPCGNNNDCEIEGAVIEPTPCDADGNFSVDIDFEYNNTSDQFTIIGNGNDYGTFSYNDLPITIADLVADGTTYEFIIKDIESPGCSVSLGYDSENCIGGGDCEIVGLEVEAFDCDAELGTYFLVVNFEVENQTDESFDLFINNEFFGFYPLSELPLTFLYVGSPFNGGFIQACINDNPDCCATVEYANPCGNNNDCEIGTAAIEPTPCDADGNFNVTIDFEHGNTSDFFSIVGNGNNYGTFAYADLPITISDLEGNGMTYEFIIKDEEHPDCGVVLGLDSEDCSNPSDCEIAQLDVYPLSCNPDGTYSVLVLFDYENIDSDLFDVYAAGDYIGSYLYEDLPLTIPSFPASGDDIDVLTICDSDSDECCEVAEFEALDCTACNIAEVIIEEGACDDQNNFEILLNLEIEGAGDLGFLVFGNGNNYGNFDYADLPISLGLFDGDGITAYEFIVVDIANPDCVGYAELGPVDCQSPQPIWPGDINNDYIANHYDLLNLGIAFNETGAARINSDIDWADFDGDDWSGQFINGTNWKHADCNGDGVVNNIDITAIENNYNQVHGDVTSIDVVDVLPGSPLFFIDLPDFDEVTMGQAFVAPIILGDIDTPVEEIYGIAFKVRYDPEMMDEAGVYVETGSSWLGEQGSQLISIDKSFADEGLIEVAITRTDHNNISGFGTVSYFIGIIDDIAGKTELSVEITDVVAITYEEARVTFETPLAVMNLTTSTNELLDEVVTVFPNPADDFITIKTTGEKTPRLITVYNMLGQVVTQMENPVQNQRMDLRDWNAGVYFLDIQFDEGKVSRKVEVLK